MSATASVRRLVSSIARTLGVGRAAKTPGVGRVRWGDLRRLAPISREFGFDRGTPIDRFYIERFLDAHRADVRGRVLEVGDASYTRRFGGDRVTHADVLHATVGNPDATFVADLSDAPHIPDDRFDCIILTQTLQLVFDLRAAIGTLHRILAPGGVLLLTVPGITQLADRTWRDRWYWSFTDRSVELLLGERFPPESVRVELHGNVLASIAFLQGLAVGELRAEELLHRDRDYALCITAAARKRAFTVG